MGRREYKCACLFLAVQDNKCVVFNWQFQIALIVARSVTDAIYLLHMLLQVMFCHIICSIYVLVYKMNTFQAMETATYLTFTCLLSVSYAFYYEKLPHLAMEKIHLQVEPVSNQDFRF
jgi:hypothetical protein